MSDFPPPPPPGSPYQPYPAVQQAPRNGMGIAALVLGLIGIVVGIIPFFFWLAVILGVIGLVFGIIGRGRATRGEATNGTMALWGIITSAIAMVLSIVGLVILLGVFEDLAEEAAVETESTVTPTTTESPTSPPAETSPPQDEETTPAEAEEISVFKLAVGDCFNGPQEGAEEELISTVPVVPCSEPHSDEVYALVNLPDSEFPGQDGIYAQGDELCVAEFEGFVGLSYRESALDYWLIAPDEEGWRAGDREVVCNIYDPAGNVTGTLSGADR
jgi:hypothetical protein